MAARVVRPSSVAAAIAAHVIVALALAVCLRMGAVRGRPDVLIPAERLVWVEPAPPLAPPARAEEAVGAGARESETPPAIQHATEAPEQRVVKKAPAKAPARATPASRPAHPLGDEQREGVPKAGPVDTSTDHIAGTTAGVVGGAPGGLGDAPLPLAAVARPPELLSRVLPEYPPRARALAVEGQVLLEMVLDRDGRPEADVRIVRSLPLLDAAAIAAVRQWRFRPARDAEGRPVRVVMQVPVRFELR